MKQAKATKHEGWIEESKGQAQKWAGKLTGDEAKAQAGADKQLAGNMEKHMGKMEEEVIKAA